MNKYATWTVAALSASLFFLSGCSAPTNSAERNAKHFIYASDEGFDPNFTTRKQQSIKLATPFFEQFWQEGKKDKDNGLTQAEANERVKYFTSDAFFNSFKNVSMFAGKAYDGTSKSLKWRKSMSESVSSAYLDGYYGRS